MSIIPDHHFLTEMLKAYPESTPGYDVSRCLALRLALLGEGLCEISDFPQQPCEASHPGKIAMQETLAQPAPAACSDMRDTKLSKLRLQNPDLKEEARTYFGIKVE